MSLSRRGTLRVGVAMGLSFIDVPIAKRLARSACAQAVGGVANFFWQNSVSNVLALPTFAPVSNF